MLIWKFQPKILYSVQIVYNYLFLICIFLEYYDVEKTYNLLFSLCSNYIEIPTYALLNTELFHSTCFSNITLKIHNRSAILRRHADGE